jgi:hypothetical protein
MGSVAPNLQQSLDMEVILQKKRNQSAILLALETKLKESSNSVQFSDRMQGGAFQKELRFLDDPAQPDHHTENEEPSHALSVNLHEVVIASENYENLLPGSSGILLL